MTLVTTDVPAVGPVLAYSSTTQLPANILAGTYDLQMLEKSPDGDNGGVVYAGRVPIVGAVFGRMYTFPARYLHQLSARLSNLAGAAAGANNLRLRWRWYR